MPWFATDEPPSPGAVSIAMAKDSAYAPPDPTLIEVKREALDYWARTLETDPEKIRQAVQKVGPVLETVKKELGIAGV